ncbi:unnamed protein product [Sphenostylis stenocarpa]|uniref:DUF8039 domain-containing protein n=1 Tax=Sphenostylis stenocarpa TaxID=92480 RepID=A0AA86VHZ1_9FABA|nr:unnamed protein product [Sphenostylis stenocarpa]
MSCATAANVPLGEDTNHPIKCELYVEDIDSPWLMAFGKMFGGFNVLHNVPLPAHLVKVMIEKVRNDSVIVIMPIDEVTNVAQILKTFIDQPRHLVSLISDNTV